MTISVEVRDSNVSKSMMQLKRTLIREGLFKELKKRKFYTKPSVAKRLKREA
ncbi:MAG: 30S ribosomal protein S21, partial [SAR324 cluster bacterium]|nr:30S ribosomal protein S21 [SAR324 cluster bacterium]MEE3021688.1 30S ribosomal protein S21 [SAR324 cluster bacterium]MEE3123604.1 30S ribosomal protein S21 [SAR324 cluster bacterium]